MPLLCHIYLLPVMERLAEQLQGKMMHATCSLSLESGGEGTVEFAVAGEGDWHRLASREGRPELELVDLYPQDLSPSPKLVS